MRISSSANKYFLVSCDYVISILCFALTYWVIVQYDGDIVVYRTLVAKALMVVASVLMLLYWFAQRQSYLISNAAAIFWSAFFILATASAFAADNSYYAFSQLHLYFSIFVLGLAFQVWLNKPSLTLIIGVLVALCLAHIMVLLLIVGSAFGFFGELKGQSIPYHANIRHVAYFGLVASCSGVVVFIFGKKLRLAGFFFSLISTFGLVFLGQRGGLGGFIVFLVCAGVLVPRLRRRLVLAGSTILLITFSTVYVLDIQGITNPYASGSLTERVRASGSGVLVDSSGRVEIWKSAASVGLERSLLGHGPDGFRRSKIKKPATIQQPHNTFIQLFVEFGFPGLVLMTVFVAINLKAIMRRALAIGRSEVRNPVPAYLVAMLLSFFAFSLVDGLFYHVVPLVIFSIICPLTFAAIYSSTLKLRQSMPVSN